MNRSRRLEESLAGLLRYGSWLASAAIGLGFALAFCDVRFGTRNLAILPNMRVAEIGIVLFILLPTLRVLLMLLAFIHEGDFRLAATACLVFATIVLAIFLGFRAASVIAQPYEAKLPFALRHAVELDVPGKKGFPSEQSRINPVPICLEWLRGSLLESRLDASTVPRRNRWGLS
jgi:hypothetical protein